MRHIRQRAVIDCGVATAAMLAGVSYTETARVANRLLHEAGMGCASFIEVMEALTGSTWRITRPVKRPLADYRLPAAPAAIVIRPDYRDYGHWIAFDGERIFDPDITRIYPVTTYPKRHWKVIRTVKQLF
jgi:hypothetical protein